MARSLRVSPIHRPIELLAPPTHIRKAFKPPIPKAAVATHPAWYEQLSPRLDGLTNSVQRHGNNAQLLVDGPQSWRKRLELLRDARLILIKTYEFLDDPYGREMAERLRQRAMMGCTIIIVYDFKGTMGFPRSAYDKLVPPILATLARLPNVTLVPCYVPRGPTRLFLPCDHKKYFITLDGKGQATLLMGGVNIGERYFTPQSTEKLHPYRDTDVAVCGPIVMDAVQAFLNCIPGNQETKKLELRRLVRNMVRPSPLAVDNVRCRLVCNGPANRREREHFHALLEGLLRNIPAHETVLISQGYFLPENRTIKAMVAAARRGVVFKVLTNSPTVPDGFGHLVATAARSQHRRMWREFPAGTLKIYEWGPGKLSSVHAKCLCFGRSGPVWVGSANFDAVSAGKNDETLVLLDDERLNKQFHEAFESDLRLPNVEEIVPTTARRWSKAACWERLIYGTLGNQL